jgi:hypothetical protein
VPGKTVDIDYTEVELSLKPQLLIEVGAKLSEIGRLIELAYEGIAQDIEGAIVKQGTQLTYYVVQTRAQI